MDMSTQMPMVGYFIYRSGEQADPTALEFCPPKGSDELFFALKTAYPHVKTHSDRMRNAVIEFLKQELNAEQTQLETPTIPLETDLSFDMSTESPWWPSMDSTASTLSSPDLFNMATPASMSSSQAPAMSRQNSSSQPSSSQKARPALEDMTGVFSLSSTSQPKTRVRRKMTESEKLEYRKRRIVKACDSCSKRKRKCSHNQPEMEKVRSSKVTKSKAPAFNISLACVEQIEKVAFQPAEPSIVDEDPFMFLNQNMFNELPTTEQFFFGTATITQAPEQTVWPWSDTPDWTLIDTPLLAQASPSSPSYHQTLFPASSGLLSPQPTPQLGLIHEPAEQARASGLPTTTQTPTHTWHTFADLSTADGIDGKEQTASMGLSSPGDMMSPTRQRNQYSTMATLTGTQPSFSRGSTSGASSMPSGSFEMSPQAIPQANGLSQTAPRPDSQQAQGSGGSIGGSGLISGLQQVSSRVSNSRSSAGLRNVVIAGDASSLTTNHMAVGDRHIGNSGNTSSTAASAEAELQSPARPLLPARSIAGLSSSSSSASGGLFALVGETSNRGLSETLKKRSAASGSISHEGIAAIGKTPSAARPASLSADSTSTSSSSSTLRTAPASPRRQAQAASPDLHGGLSARAATPSKPFHQVAHDEDPGNRATVMQTETRPEEGSEESSPTQGENARTLPLESGTRRTHGRSRAVASSPSDADTTVKGIYTAPQSATTPQQPLRHRNKRSPGNSLAPATSANLDLNDTRVAAAILVAQVCMTWRAMAGAFVQAVATTQMSCRDGGDCQSLPLPRQVLAA
ncbi:hypothetical protein E4T42_08018 [Aureobasidium subglaciale]|nr:hypothetical protein E4T42_08018 [Aureobasidium subglaciale]